MHRSASSLIIALPLCACTPQQVEPEAATATAASGVSVECIPLDQVVGRRPEKPNMVAFFLAGGQAYVNKLPDHCPGIAQADSGSIVHVETTGSQLCRGDRVRIYDPVEAKNIGVQAFPHCRLGGFTPTPIVRVNRVNE